MASGLVKAAQGIGPFNLELEGVGAFPNGRAPRVIWVGIKKSAELERLQQNVEKCLVSIGFEAEDRPFTPHLTLCRIKSAEDGRALGKLLSEARVEAKTAFTVSSFAFIKSVLKPFGAEYTPIREFALTAQNN